MLLSVFLVVSALGAECRRADASAGAEPSHFVFFGLDHERIVEPAFLTNDRVAGAQLTVTWKQLEPERDRYDFTEVRDRLEFLERHGKRLWLQVQDVSFADWVFVPNYLVKDTAFHGGAARKYEGKGEQARFGGWVARRWDPVVRSRYARWLDVLGREFDGRIEGINIPETSVGFDHPAFVPAGFTPGTYAEGIRDMITAARRAFPRSCVVIYGNFMPGEWLPEDDKGYLRSVYAHAAKVGAGVGGPDLMPHRPGQRNHSLALIAARPSGVIAAVAVQDGNLAEMNPATGKRVTVEELHRFAKDRLRLDYMFWGTEEPYYTRDVLPFLRALGRNQ